MQNHPSVLNPIEQTVQDTSEPTQEQPVIDRDLSGWRKRFRKPNGDPLPPDGTRVDVRTGERLETLR